MSIPAKVSGFGNNSTTTNVFKVTFSQPTSDVPTLEAWDNENFNTTANQVFTGTTANGNKPMVSAVATTLGAPISAWNPTVAAGGGATINRLKGSTNYINLSNAPISGGSSILFNLNWEIPYDATVPANMDLVFIIRYAYSGTAPVLTWYFNDSGAGGTESVPVWTAITSGTSGNKIKPADAGCSYNAIVLHKPVSSVADAPELWVTT